ncbi:sugar phosphate isomerase/epimerase family protein [Vallitalea guaymasensis]|uniref:sugar phosphate isomerase/epimerase family protein n=2 Tax=Vallitalea guaymasensis TaxID=1185412 RepID=UPI002729759F|nr:TIM barrel protein [Vallitalea guaymasensis]
MDNKLVIGMPTLVEYDSLQENIDLCIDLGLDFIEINMNLPQFQPDRLDILKLKEYQKKHGIFFTFHLPEELDIANFNYRVSNAYLNVVKDVIEIAESIKSPIINMHMNLGVYFTLPSKKVYLYSTQLKEYLERQQYFGELIDNVVKGSNIKISIENTGIYNYTYIVQAITKLLEYDNFVLTWDIGHDFSSSDIDRDYIMKNIDKLCHLHIHDAIGKRNHLPLFNGEIDIHKVLELARKRKCTSVIETKTVAGLKQSVGELKKRGYV